MERRKSGGIVPQRNNLSSKLGKCFDAFKVIGLPQRQPPHESAMP
jgi:hypothetical protein